MKSRIITFVTLCLLLAAITACTPQSLSPQDIGNSSGGQSISSENVTDLNDANILIAYFTRLDNTDADLDEIIQGGGPYGNLGESFEDADVDAITSASITVMNDQAQGNVETLAQMIHESVGGTLFSIQTERSYPVNYDELIELGGDEKNTNARPSLSVQVDDMDSYDVIFIGYPNWWYDMPMAVYQFLESYDFSGKTVIPFASSAGSGFSGTIGTIQELLPDASVLENGLHIHMTDVAQAQQQVDEWLAQLGF